MIKPLALLFLMFSLSGCTTSLQSAESNFNEGNYLNAIKKARTATAFAGYGDNDDDTRAHILFIEAESYHHLNEQEKAFGIYSYICQNYPNTKYGSISKEIISTRQGVPYGMQ